MANDKRDDKIVKGAAAADAYFALNHPPTGRILLVNRAEAAKAMAARFEQYRVTLNAPKPPRGKR